MISTNEEIRVMANACMKLLDKLNRGDLLPYAEFERATKLKRHGRRWQTLVGKVRRRLLAERGIWLRTMTSQGFRLCDPAEQIGEVADQQQRVIRKRIRQNYRTVEGVRPEELSEFEAGRRAFRLQAIAAQAAAYAESQRLQAHFAKPSSTTWSESKC